MGDFHRFPCWSQHPIHIIHELLQDDLLVGIPEAGRSGDLSVLQNIMGFFVFLGKGLCVRSPELYLAWPMYMIEYVIGYVVMWYLEVYVHIWHINMYIHCNIYTHSYLAGTPILWISHHECTFFSPRNTLPIRLSFQHKAPGDIWIAWDIHWDIGCPISSPPISRRQLLRSCWRGLALQAVDILPG